MRITRSCAGFVAGALLTLTQFTSSVCADPYASIASDRVQDLSTTKTFDETLLKAGRRVPLLLVHVHGRCSSCQALAPAFAAAADRASKTEGADLVMRDVVFGRVDGRTNAAFMDRYGIEGNSAAEREQDDPSPKDSAASTDNGSKKAGKSIPGYPILAFTKPSTEPVVIPVDDNLDLDGKVDAILTAARQQIRLQSPARTSKDILAEMVKHKVLALNADTFHGVVFDQGKDVFVKFYAPWCSHCKKLAPRYEKVAKLFAEHPSCMVTTFNSDPPAERAIAKEHKIRGFPTLKFYPSQTNTRTNATKAEPEEYRGARSPEALVEFLNSRCGTELKLPSASEEWEAWTQSWKRRIEGVLGLGKTSAGGEVFKDGRGTEL
ncbi:hypothetical protein OC846_003200 [Tilletia horrida]|uniref:Thioredoxin domain-containing protein n=1 Tax=Tilletia horrida TaxID=155126 RepID=A0AAN6JY73_9BASI|nr:hypothetical protein OC846_003200 [Tilletia horrida]KAK0569679.1 hypothetical protein OC861_000639 [Tilletia horrida]